LTLLVVAGEGTYSVDPLTGVVTFDPLPGFVGPATAVSYQVSDTGTGVNKQTTSSTITPTVVALPTVVPDTTTGPWNTAQSINVLTNTAGTSDRAATGATLVASSVKLCLPTDVAPNCTATSVTVAGQGTYTLSPTSGVIIFTPLPSFTGTATPVVYSVTDNFGQKASTTYTPTVNMPPPPVATPQTLPVAPGDSVTFTKITGTGGLATGVQLDPASVCIVVGATCVKTLTTTDGTWTVDSVTGAVTFTANANLAPGTIPSITYRVTDEFGQTATSTLTPVVPPLPVARPDTSLGEQGATQILSLLGNDSAGSATTKLVPSSVYLCAATEPPPNCSATTVTVPGEGTYTVNALGLVTFVPEPGFVGVATPIKYQVADNLGQIATSTISVTVLGPPYPSAVVDTGSAPYAHTVTFQPWLNDSPGTPPTDSTIAAPKLVPSSIRLCAANESAPNCTSLSVTTVDGTYVVNPKTGEVVFTPVRGFTGTATSPVTYIIKNDWSGSAGPGTAVAVLIPTIGPIDSPSASVDIGTTKPGTSITIVPTTNDKPGSVPLKPQTIKLCGATEVSPLCTQLKVTTADGTYVVNPATGNVTFTPRRGFTGIATIAYVISDIRGKRANSNIIITVADNKVPELPKTGANNLDVIAKFGLALILLALLLSRTRRRP